MVEENCQLKRSEMPQNEGFLVKAHSILHLGKGKFQFRSTETHQNLGFCVKSD